MQPASSSHDNHYFIDVENNVERQRLARQGRFLQEGLHGHLPEFDLSHTHRILDIACGDGAWVLHMAQTYLDKEVVGVDLSSTAIEFAQERAAALGRSNATFKVMNALEPFDFPDSSFDLVNARSVYGFLRPTDWPRFVQESARLLTSGGVLRLTEGEFGLSNGKAAEALSGLVARLSLIDGMSFSPDGRHTGITPMLHLFLRDAGMQSIQRRAYSIEYLGANWETQQDLYYNLIAMYKLFEQRLLAADLVSHQEFENLSTQFSHEMRSHSFSLIWYYLTVWGQKQV